MADNIVVTATGICSALGNGRAEHLAALRAARHGLRHPVLLKTVHAQEVMAGEVDADNDTLAAALALPGGNNGYTRTTLLAMMAIRELRDAAGAAVWEDEGLAFVNANTVGGMCAVEDMYAEFLSEARSGDFIRYINTLDCAESTENIARQFPVRPLTATISTACSSSANALILGARLIRLGRARRAVCGGCDALSRFTVNGFSTLKNMDTGPCRPFDQHRNGLNLGEGAGYLLLERESDARARGAEILAVFSGYCNSNDAYHPTAPSPDGAGALRTMKGALEKAGLAAEDIGYINAHGTATLSNDIAEGKAIEDLFGSTALYSSTKPYTGHTLAAAGAIEAIFSIWALQEQTIFPNLNFQDRMEELQTSPVTRLLEHIPLQHVMSNSFGFGGNNVSLIFSKS
jgi:3-oxoacyl-(acyl-carrier-protein) synthase